MIPSFTLHQPDELESASALLGRYGEEARIIAGGSELILVLKLGLASPGHLLDITRIATLGRLEQDAGDRRLRIGALVTHRALENSEVVQKDFPLLARMEKKVANVRVRNVGTLAGNLCFADPHSDPGTLLLAYGAKVHASSSGGERTLEMSDFFLDYYKTALGEDEILTEVELPRLEDRLSGAYLRFCPGERPTVTVAVLMGWQDGVCEDVRIALGCVAPKPFRALEVEGEIKGRSAAEIRSGADDAGRKAADLSDPLADVWGSVGYKKQIVKTLVSRALSQLCEGKGK